VQILKRAATLTAPFIKLINNYLTLPDNSAPALNLIPVVLLTGTNFTDTI
jgi:hypothetical protein